MVLMAVVPQLGLVEQEEKHQPDQQAGKQRLNTGLAFKSLGQQVHESRRQQSAGGQAEHVLGVTGQYAKAQKRCKPDATNAGDQCPQ